MPPELEIAISSYQTYEKLIALYTERDAGKDGLVFKISDNAAVKIPKICYWGIGREMMIAKMLYGAGISVPKPFVWDYVRMDSLSEPVKGFIMEYIPGKSGFWLEEYEHNKARIKAKEEIKKAKQMRFCTIDAMSNGNYILTPLDKIVLVDFAEWEHPDVPSYVEPESVFAKLD